MVSASGAEVGVTGSFLSDASTCGGMSLTSATRSLPPPLPVRIHVQEQPGDLATAISPPATGGVRRPPSHCSGQLDELPTAKRGKAVRLVHGNAQSVCFLHFVDCAHPNGDKQVRLLGAGWGKTARPAEVPRDPPTLHLMGGPAPLIDMVANHYAHDKPVGRLCYSSGR